jgi:hypothetical protein
VNPHVVEVDHDAPRTPLGISVRYPSYTGVSVAAGSG